MFYFILFYLFFGYYHILINKEPDSLYTILLVYFTFKIIIDYRKCTLSYIECKIRNIKKDKGYINNFFDDLFSIRNETKEKRYLLLMLSFILSVYFVFIKNSEMKYMYNDLKNKLQNSI